VSGGSSAHHQEHKTVHTTSGIVKPILLSAAIVDEMDLQQGATFSRSIYFYKLLYMFQVVPPPIIRSTKLYTASGIVKPIVLPAAIVDEMERSCGLCVQFCAPDDGRRNRMKNVEQFIEINRSTKRCILLVVL
jgi:hypothetical protein